jgi:hypothetical protein
MATTQRQQMTFGGSVTGLSNARLAGSIGIGVLQKTMSGPARAAKP